MSQIVKSIKITYDPINKQNTFTGGDWLTGQVTLEVVKECHIDSLFVHFKGKSEVLWHKSCGQALLSYHSKNKYFSIKHYFVRDKDFSDNENELFLTKKNGESYNSYIAPGCHVYPFSFQFPTQHMPSSFTGEFGKIVYTMRTKLSRSMKIPQKHKITINYVTNEPPSSDLGIMTPQHESKDKKMKFFTSGSVAMDVRIEKTGYCQGEGIKVIACIENNSSREIKPKYCVYRKHTFFAEGQRNLCTKDLLKEVGQPIPPSSNVKVSQVISIPHDAEPSILNCSNIKAEYRLRVYLDVKYALDPKIKFPIVILPAHGPDLVPPSSSDSGFDPLPSASAAGFDPPPSDSASGFDPPPSDSASGFDPFGNTNPPQWGSVPQQPSQDVDPPPPYGAFEMYPPLTDIGHEK